MTFSTEEEANRAVVMARTLTVKGKTLVAEFSVSFLSRVWVHIMVCSHEGTPLLSYLLLLVYPRHRCISATSHLTHPSKL